MRNKGLRALLVVIASLAALEFGVRTTGLLDFPTFEQRDDIGYVARPEQHGRFLRARAWAYNDRGMRTARPWSPARPQVLLIGNSVVAGGNPYDQSETLGVLLEAALPGRTAVWPIGAGGWSNVNETAYLEAHPDVVAACDVFVWEVMSGGFAGHTPWRSDLQFPRERPAFGTWYVVQRYLLPRLGLVADASASAPRAGAGGTAGLARFEAMVARLAAASTRPRPGAFLLYPDRAQLERARRGERWLDEADAIAALASRHGVDLIDLTRSPQWQPSLYRDEVHPSVEGNRVLASIIAAALASDRGTATGPAPR